MKGELNVASIPADAGVLAVSRSCCSTERARRNVAPIPSPPYGVSPRKSLITFPICKHHILSISHLVNCKMSSDALNDPQILEHVEKFWEGRKPSSPIYQFLLDDIKITYASKGVVRARLPLTNNHVNTHGGIHGAVSATLIDWVGGIAIAAYDNRTKTGVSTDIHISYQSSAKSGDTIEIEGKAGKVGGTLAFTTATIWKVVDDKPGPIVATGSHTKFVRV
jgi:acyl-coenzyme A thioesterase 13